MLLTILSCIFVFGVLITVHELGHFMVAKAVGMRVDEFAIGFGPKLYERTEGETQYSLRLLPLGGYNRIYGMEPGEDADPRAFNTQTLWKRMAVILAGSGMNLLLPLFIFFGIFFFHGIQEPVNEPVLGGVVPKFAAEAAGLRQGDRMLTMNGVPLKTWQDLRAQVAASADKPLVAEVERDGKTFTATLHLTPHPETGQPFAGVIASTRMRNVGFGESVLRAFQSEKYILAEMYQSLYHILTGKQAAEVSGPIGVAKLAGQVAERGLVTLLNFLAMLSLNLAVINLLPLPALDGGHFFLLLIEGVTGHKFGEKAMENIQKVGIALILTVTLIATYQDLMR